MIQKTTLAKALRAIAVAIEGLTEEEVEQLIAGKGKLTFTVSEKPKQPDSSPSNDTQVIGEKLNNCKDRDEARRVLSQITNKDALASLAKLQKIHVAKHDRREDIENKLIEFVIGGRLRTEAIQTLNLRSGGGSQQNG
ncbi:MAG: hypothetical protein AB7G75_24040 [Candidatus Binatia bacterium]